MTDTKGLLDRFKHHDKLGISIISNDTFNLPEEVIKKLLQPNRFDFYFFVFVYSGTATYTVDLEPCKISNGQLLFTIPNQIITPPQVRSGAKYYKVSFDDNTLALLPQQYQFLVNPKNFKIISFDNQCKERVKMVFEMLLMLLHGQQKTKDTTLILAYLNSLLTEINNAYFENRPSDHVGDQKLSKYIEFRLAVESHLTEQQSILTIAEQLATSTTSLYSVVKDFSGVSPKEYITNRLMLEAQRKLRYSKISIKELAFDLGYNDPDYFSRLFKKHTGKTVSQFLQTLH